MKIILCIWILIKIVLAREIPDLTYFIRNVSNKVEPICIADRNVLESAIGWSYPIEDMKDKLPFIVTKYVPALENDYNCDFLKTKPCSNLWQMENWQLSKFDSHPFKPTLDPRWEDFPTLLTSISVKEFKNRIDIPHTFEIGISIRAERIAEVFLCTGYDPYSFPCYYISIGGYDNEQAFLRKYKSIPEKMLKNDTKLYRYLSDDKLLSENEWKHFIVSLTGNGTIALVDMVKNVTLMTYNDSKLFQPIYLFIRSKDAKALWKIYNGHYIFTDKSNLTQLGPTFAIYGESLCVSLYVAMCRYCRMTFYIMINGEKQIIKSVFNENEHDDLLWKKIRLVQHDILEDKIKLFIETKYINNTVVPDGFWGIDDVRVCFEDEIKVTRLIANSNYQESDLQHISCEAIAIPTWRPIPNSFLNDTVEIEFSATTSAIHVTRKTKHVEELHNQQFYIIQYEGKEICNQSTSTRNKSRLKSRGFIVARSAETVITDLVPYTRYTISIWNVVDELKIVRDVSTIPTDIPNSLELPKNIVIHKTTTTCEVTWDPPKCDETFGPIIYQVQVYIKNGTWSSTQTDITTQFNFKDLQPDVNYEVEIRTARKLENLKDLNLSLSSVSNFTTTLTASALVFAPTNLEVYATSKSSAQLRFDLPKNLQVKPNSTQTRSCHPLLFEKCKSDVQELRECKLWKNKFCVDINNLTSGFMYTFFVSLKNNDNYSNGDEANMNATIIDRVPGVPTNVTYRMKNCISRVDCCHLNITWNHPFNQSSSITMFDIILTEASYTFVFDSFKSIHEILKVTEESYRPIYNYNVKYISCNVPYKISVRAVNDYYKGQFASTVMAVNNSINYVDPMPTYINSTNETVVFRLPKAETGLESSTLIIVVQDYNKNKTKINEEINQLEMFDDVNELCNQFGETYVAKSIELKDVAPFTITIGDGTSSYVSLLNKTVVNKRLTPDTQYCFTFTIIKRLKEAQHVIVYHNKNLFTEATYIATPLRDEASASANVATYLLPVLFIALLVVCGAWVSYRYFQKKRYGASGDHVYESMPFEDYLTDAVSNDTYDRLSHE